MYKPKRVVALFLITIILGMVFPGNSFYPGVVRAEEIQDLQQLEEPDKPKEPDEPKEPVFEDAAEAVSDGNGSDEVPADVPEADEVEKDAQESAGEEPEAEKDTLLTGYFYIRGNGIGADIPEEPKAHSSLDYSEVIRVAEAVSVNGLKLSTKEVDGSEEDLLEDGFTASNEVSESLIKLPSSEDIMSVVPEFDPEKHYVVWYVAKDIYGAGDSLNMRVHVDGVIRSRQSLITLPKDPELEKLEEEVEIVLVPLYLDENGNDAKEIVFDGKKHIVGGFKIIVADKNDDLNVLQEFLYNCYGRLLETKVYAEDDRTAFSYRGQEFFVNVTAAYAEVMDVGDVDIKYYSGSKEIAPEEIKITDRVGAVLSEGISPFFQIIAKPGKVTVQKEITITAGTTVRNDNGTTLTDSSYELSGALLEGHRVENVVMNGSLTGVGKCPNEITYVSIIDANGNDVTHLYKINKVSGRLQLVDGGKKSSESSISASDSSGETSGEDILISGNATSFGTVVRSKVKNADGSVTYINVPYETSAANDVSGNLPQVLGARRAETGDYSPALLTRCIMILICLGFMAAYFMHNKDQEV